MKGIDNIIKEILDGAKSDVEATAEQTKTQVDSIMQKAKDDVAKQVAAIQKDTDSKCEEATRREKTILDVELRRNKLQIRRQLVDVAFEDALGNLCDGDKARYDELVLSMLLGAAETGSEEVVVGKDNKIDKQIVDKANKALSDKGMDGKLAIAKDTGDFAGGFVLRDKGIETNCTFAMLISQVKPMIEREVAGIIFPN